MDLERLPRPILVLKYSDWVCIHSVQETLDWDLTPNLLRELVKAFIFTW